MKLSHHFACILATVCVSDALRTSLLSPSKPIGQVLSDSKLRVSSRENRLREKIFQEHYLSVPIDHFYNESRYEPHTSERFPLRYWFDATYYKHGGPVFVLQGGETSGEDRLPLLQKGIIHQLAEATNGIAVVLEHRYYGKSYPTKDFSTQNLRFLTTEQAMADQAYFAENIKFPGLDHFGDLTSHVLPYIAYGGSYAGAFVAFLRVQYPDVFWGAISSSGVTLAVYDYWQYYQPIIDLGPKQCIQTQQKFTHIVDNIITGKGQPDNVGKLQAFFGLANISHISDFTQVLSSGLYSWQNQNWDPAESDPTFDEYCGNITSDHLIYPETRRLQRQAESTIEAGGYQSTESFVNQLLNYVGYLNATQIDPWSRSNKTQDEYFGTYDEKAYLDQSTDNIWRLWPYQYCTEWGYLQTGSGYPKDGLPLVSRTIDLAHEMTPCNLAFNITSPPDLQRINKYGGYNISYPRLAIIDGDRDPWRPATPHAFEFGARNRSSTDSEPFILIENAIHHYDENGVFQNETRKDFPPRPVVDAQAQELAFVKVWLEQWQQEGRRYRTDL